MATEPETTDVAGRLGSGYHRTDLGNAERLVDQHGQNLRYIHPWNRWLVWDGRRWATDDNGHLEHLAQQTVRGILAEAISVDDPDERRKLVTHALASERAPRVRELAYLARSRPGIPVRPNDLDTDPHLLNLRNGTLDLRALELKPHRREDLLTKIADVDYDPGATAPRWERFLTEIFEGDQELVSFAQRAVGYSLTGDTSAQVFFLLHGSGQNGKSTFLEACRALLGDYAQQTPADTFLEKRYQGIPNDVARLQGARFVTAVETGENRRLDEALVKRMTGGDAIAARFMRAEWFEFTPLFKVWLATNHKPQIRGTDRAIWRRIRLIPFNVTIPPEKRDDQLPDKLHEELPGILNWAIRGLRDYAYGDGLEPPTAVTAATDEYRDQQDVLGAFLQEHTRDDPTGRATAADLYAAYKSWAAAANERAETQTSFGLRLRERGYTSLRIKGRAVWGGIRLADDTDLFTDAALNTEP